MARKGNGLLEWCQENGERGKRLSKEYTGITEDGQHIPINLISYGSGKKVKWKCSKCKQEWYSTVSNRTRKNHERGCPYCAGKIVTDKNSLETWCKSHGTQGAQILKEYTGETEDGTIIPISAISYGSSKQLKWCCSTCGEYWYTTVNNRTRGSKCTNCYATQTSFPEQFIYKALKQVIPETENRVKVLKNKYSQGLELNIGIPILHEHNGLHYKGLVIDYSEQYWYTYTGREYIDTLKEQECKAHGIRFLTISEIEYEHYYIEINEDNYITTYAQQYLHDNCTRLKEIVIIILQSLSIPSEKISQINFAKVEKQAYLASHGKLEYERSLVAQYPELLAEWNYELNSKLGIEPSQITPGSRSKAYFKCTNCFHSWQAAITKRVSSKTGCPNCGFNIFKAAKGQPQKLRPNPGVRGTGIKAQLNTALQELEDFAKQHKHLDKD